MSIKKQKKAARELLNTAHKIYQYRRDVTSKGDLEDLDKAVETLEELCSDETAESKAIRVAMNRVDRLLRKIGGKMYPKTFWNDNFEVALIGAIIVLGIRTFFFQPFIIPTNSMYPTYSGMNATIYENDEATPSMISKVFRFLTLGARHKSLKAKASGEIQFLGRQYVKGKKWFVLPTILAEYTFKVGEVPHVIRVPGDFDMLKTIKKIFPNHRVVHLPNGQMIFDLNTSVEVGETIFRFDITLGDALFVDRISYHFTRPQPGDPFVFRTREIPGIEGDSNSIVDKYYIKRIAGVSGETLEISEDGSLLVNESPRDEVAAFRRNARKEGLYQGYTYPDDQFKNPNRILTAPGVKNQVPEGKYVALGDNSANSQDSRYWGYVPEKSVIGKAVFIHYPFTKRWGLAE